MVIGMDILIIMKIYINLSQTLRFSQKGELSHLYKIRDRYAFLV